MSREIQNTDRVHILPLNDLKLHVESSACHCKPRIEDDGYLVIHNAYDGREFFEEEEQPKKGH